MPRQRGKWEDPGLIYLRARVRACRASVQFMYVCALDGPWGQSQSGCLSSQQPVRRVCADESLPFCGMEAVFSSSAGSCHL